MSAALAILQNCKVSLQNLFMQFKKQSTDIPADDAKSSDEDRRPAWLEKIRVKNGKVALIER